MIYAIATNRVWYHQIVERLQAKTNKRFVLLTDKEQVTQAYLSALQPRYVFFPHWSHLIPADVYENYECVVFHMTDVPFGRGGSPLQNLISRGINETKISALKCEKEIDAGPVYIKKSFSLYGTAEEIYMRAADRIEQMIHHIVEQEPQPIDQTGEVVHFKRRKPKDGDIRHLSELQQVFDYIRMLDADGYPRAFLETEHFKLEFERAAIKQDHVVADVKITRKGDCNE